MPHDTNLEKAVDLVTGLIRRPAACCLIVDEGYPDESSLHGTRDAYLHMALRLLEFVQKVEHGEAELENGVAWDDGIKAALLQLPTDTTWIVGAYLHANHRSMLDETERWLGDRLKFPLSNDPDFDEPSLGSI